MASPQAVIVRSSSLKNLFSALRNHPAELWTWTSPGVGRHKREEVSAALPLSAAYTALRGSWLVVCGFAVDVLPVGVCLQRPARTLCASSSLPNLFRLRVAFSSDSQLALLRYECRIVAKSCARMLLIFLGIAGESLRSRCFNPENCSPAVHTEFNSGNA